MAGFGTWQDPKPLYPTGDSACISVFDNTAYSLLSAVPPYQVNHRALVAVGDVNLGYVPVPAPAIALGSNGAAVWREAPGSGTIHRAYVVDNFVSYERSTDNGATWNYQNSPDFGTNPSLALCDGNPTIAYLRGDSVMAATLNSDSGWKIQTLYAGTSTAVPGAPSLAMFSSGTRRGNVCFPVYEAGPIHTEIVYIQFDTTGLAGSVQQDIVADYDGLPSDSVCCIAAASTDTAMCVYAHGDSIFMRRLVYSSIRLQ